MTMKLSGRRRGLAEAQNWRCAYCAGALLVDPSPQAGATGDHLVPRSDGGGDSRANLVAACRACNEARGAQFAAEQFWRLRQRLLRLGAWPACTTAPREVRRYLGCLAELKRSAFALEGRAQHSDRRKSQQ